MLSRKAKPVGMSFNGRQRVCLSFVLFLLISLIASNESFHLIKKSTLIVKPPKKKKLFHSEMKLFYFLILFVDYRATGLTEGLEYQFRVCALNQAGSSEYSQPSSGYLALDPVGKRKFVKRN